MLQPKKWEMLWGGRTLTVETGRLALQTNASCTVQYGDTVIMATVVKSSNVRPGLDYFPLMVDFEEKLYAAGKIKGSRFMKREGRPSDEAILAGRLIDRSIRPLFDESIREDVQVIITALAVDGENDAAITGLVAASAALSLSSIPWNGPIAAARIGMDSVGGYILNVTASELEANKTLDLVVAGTAEKLIMVEAAGTEVPEQKMFEAMKWGSEQMQPVVDFIKKIQTEAGLTKITPEVKVTPESEAAAMVKQFIADNAESMIFNSTKITKGDRVAMIDSMKTKAKEFFADKEIDEKVLAGALSQLKYSIGDVISERILSKSQRLDGRSITEIRELQVEVDLLPRVHGSGMFMRGDTQVLSVVTLGAPGDVQTLDSMEEDGKKRYMHHYNDAPYSYGEAGPLRGPGRRAIGHGALAERAIEPVLPLEADFPYAIRVVSEVLGSNGSSSMASTCGSSLSLMAAGVPLRKPVAGIAMGLASDDKGNYKVLTDLQDVEDGHGGMDFKIAGTIDGITAIQMDTKTQGLTWNIVDQTLKQALEARKTILAKMASVIAEPRADLSPYAPRIVTIQINPEKIGDLIGPGGKTIKKIVEETGVDIDIEQDGRVLITSVDATAMQKAIDKVNEITKDIMAGEIYTGKVVRLEDFGAFVSLTPNKDGLVHVSEISYDRVNRPADVLKLGDVVQVKVKEIDSMGRVNLSMKALLPKPEGYVEQERRPMGPPRSGNGGGFRKPFPPRQN
ncbi:MAG: polyribonucleotide nucleotidyltransferase [Candidatus Magasanikbacteria bacterium RIFCSPHIGHO2_02_FULL_41_13]|uniref:Polyribonucleotide nucleotidyltransferase n=1 Tax=Candidatus Magasanikbacteria bacterium RIFCSPHIGHO2_02_FULL_41_13 TaxID=1798676 RepID=A0A1F6M2R0_9BACT|nr:MAG: polyribonucleotide nucleotidyltransferase [Candidatus Magasanikbacteria bacterium RIFCSPHIGHO2_02_FULL_41_13]